MENLVIPQKSYEKFFPGVCFDAQTGNCELIGESFMESPDEFYMPLIKWLDRYMKEIKKEINFTLKISYYNTASSKFILKILAKLKEYIDSDGVVNVYWHYSSEDEDMEDEIREFSQDSGISIQPVSIV